MLRLVVVACLLNLDSTAMAHAETVRLHAAGSLKAALGEVSRAFEARNPGAKVEAHFAASGLLRERIEKGEPAHVFASANVAHPARLAEAGRAEGKVTVFARNRLCALVREGLAVTPATLLATMLDPAVRVGTSTPKADPSGDYAFALFAKADAQDRAVEGFMAACQRRATEDRDAFLGDLMKVWAVKRARALVDLDSPFGVGVFEFAPTMAQSDFDAAGTGRITGTTRDAHFAAADCRLVE